MSRLESDEPDSVEGSEFKQEEFAARFLLRALEDLRLVDDTITVEDLHTFAEKVREDLDLMIGSEKFLRDLFDVIDQKISLTRTYITKLPTSCARRSSRLNKTWLGGIGNFLFRTTLERVRGGCGYVRTLSACPTVP